MKPWSAALAACAFAACTTASAPTTPQDDFFTRFSSLCGQAFAGRVVTTDAADASFAGQPLVMQVRECGEREIRVPFHVGENRSRTWVVTRTEAGLRLKHEHRHEDGSEDVLTQYGGDTANIGTAARQEFPADDYSKRLFIDNDISVSVDNLWVVEVHPGAMLAYELRRPSRHFRVEFDLGTPIAAPPPPWGAEQ